MHNHNEGLVVLFLSFMPKLISIWSSILTTPSVLVDQVKQAHKTLLPPTWDIGFFWWSCVLLFCQDKIFFCEKWLHAFHPSSESRCVKILEILEILQGLGTTGQIVLQLFGCCHWFPARLPDRMSYCFLFIFEERPVFGNVTVVSIYSMSWWCFMGIWKFCVPLKLFKYF